jgi:hypothetical protein
MILLSETFGADHRPIIEFAIENSQKLKLRATREALAKGRQARTAAQGDGANKKAKKWEPKTNDEASEKVTAKVEAPIRQSDLFSHSMKAPKVASMDTQKRVA